MHQSSKNGRPLNRRHERAGKNLRLALKILGKTWRKNTQDTSHVLQWDDWSSYGLPRSPTTIDADIHRGIPEERLESYARCLGLTVMALTSPDSDLHALLDPRKGKTDNASSLLDLGYGPAFQEQYSKYNTREYIQNLFSLMEGVYDISYVTPTLDIILRCSFCIHHAAKNHLCGQGLFFVYGLDNRVEANIFRWHNNLHAIFHCHNMMELGHYLVIDPLRHHLVARRNPFWLKGTGVTDNGQADNAPIAFTFYMQKLERPADQTLLEFWESQCEALRQRPMILPDDADYITFRAMIEAPDSF